MMRFSHQQRVDDQTLRGYLFGVLPQEQTERLDELSVTDDKFAARLDSVENDLVDAYARGELSGETLAQFQTIYLSSPRRREKVAFAQSFQEFSGTQVAQAATNRGEPAKAAAGSWFGWLAFPRLALAGGLAMVLAIAALLFDNLHLRDSVRQANADRAALEQRESDLRGQLDKAQASSTPTTSEEQARSSVAQVENSTTAKHAASQLAALPASVVAFVLAPQVRGGTQMPVLSLPPGTARVHFQLDLETNDFPHYRVALKSLQDDKVLWHSGQLTAVTKGQSSTLSASVPAKLLQAQGYELDLTGTSSGEDELVSNYVFRVVTK
jgi:hypothetical protein